MKTLRFLFLGVIIALLAPIPEGRAQVILSPRRLTQRISPQLAPAQQYAPAPVAGQPQVLVIQTPVDPEKAQAEKEESLRKAAEFRKLRAEEEGSKTNALDNENIPLVVECRTVQPDPGQSMQSINLSLTNSCAKSVVGITMRLIYFDAKGTRIKEWTTRRELEQALPGKSETEVAQPAYFMPLVTRRVKVEVKEVRFLDGTQCPQKPGS